MRRIRTFLTLLITLALTGVTGVTFVVAQDGTPAASAHDFPLTPDPAQCTGEARDMSPMMDIWFAGDATPEAGDTMTWEMPTEITIPVGSPADEGVIDQVTATVSGLFSCFAAGDYARAMAFFTDDLAAMFGPDPFQTREEVEAFLEATPVADEDLSGQIVAITDVMMLEDGRIGAFVVDTSVDGTFTVYAIFEDQGDGTLLVDEVIYFDFSDE